MAVSNLVLICGANIFGITPLERNQVHDLCDLQVQSHILITQKSASIEVKFCFKQLKSKSESSSEVAYIFLDVGSALVESSFTSQPGTPKQQLFNDCFNQMIPNLYLGNDWKSPNIHLKLPSVKLT